MSEEVKEKKKKATKTAKLVGFSTVLSIATLTYLIISYIDEWFLTYEQGREYAAMIFTCGCILILLGIGLSIKLTKKWDKFKGTKKKILVFLMLVPAFLCALVYYDYRIEKGEPDYELGKGYTIHVHTINDEELSGFFIKWDNDFLILKGGTGYIHIPKDKIHYIEK
ncbi:hypothetical protein OAK04_02880 [Verrucomicrobia bacterium]|nr:hypothetical protein [Verrucomicrobiota bacterium]